MVSTALASSGKGGGSWNRSMSDGWWLFSLDRYVRGDLVLFAECYVVFAEKAVIREDVGNGSERLG